MADKWVKERFNVVRLAPRACEGGAPVKHRGGGSPMSASFFTDSPRLSLRSATPLINEGGKAYSVKYQFNRFPKAKKLGSPEGLPNTSILALVGIRVNTHVGEKIENLYFQQAECDGFIQYCALK